MREFLLQQNWENKNLLLMSSGTFGGLDISQLGEEVLQTTAL
jgi:UDP-N-acetylmuramate: L-alanyl-gamma-D-glutamyl-meso-diaminopimelate ligase